MIHLRRDGTVLAILNQGSGAIAPPEQPLDVAVAADGLVYVADLAGRLVRFNTAGQVDREWKVADGSGTRGGSHLAVVNSTTPGNHHSGHEHPAPLRPAHRRPA